MSFSPKVPFIRLIALLLVFAGLPGCASSGSNVPSGATPFPTLPSSPTQTQAEPATLVPPTTDVSSAATFTPSAVPTAGGKVSGATGVGNLPALAEVALASYIHDHTRTDYQCQLSKVRLVPGDWIKANGLPPTMEIWCIVTDQPIPISYGESATLPAGVRFLAWKQGDKWEAGIPAEITHNWKDYKGWQVSACEGLDQVQ